MEWRIEYFDLDGNPVREDQWADSIMRGMVQKTIAHVQEQALSAVEPMTCSEHGGKAALTFTVTGSPTEPDVNIRVEACCQEFAESARDAALQAAAN